MSSEKVERLRKELAIAETENAQEEIGNAVCPICGQKLEYRYEDRATSGEGNKLQRIKIKCTGCGLFGIEKEGGYNIIDISRGRCDKPIDVVKEWNYIKRFLTYNNTNYKIRSVINELKKKLETYVDEGEKSYGALHQSYIIRHKEVESILELIKKLFNYEE